MVWNIRSLNGDLADLTLVSYIYLSFMMVICFTYLVMCATKIDTEKIRVPLCLWSVIAIPLDNPILFVWIKCLYCGTLSDFIENPEGFKLTAAWYLFEMQHLEAGVTSEKYPVTNLSSKPVEFFYF